MKKHAIIPIFIPHRGCKNSCVFCNQRAITARSADVTPDDARRIIDEHLTTLNGRNLDEIEVSFFGGSFTGIPIEEQSAFLSVAKEYKDNGLIDKIHMSTRPDYINEEILDNLKNYGADVIELGVQSFSPKVLTEAKRGHDVECVYKACNLIKQYGFTLGIQLMIGLPGDSYEACMDSINQTISIAPSLARIYPTVVISETELYDMYKDGRYIPFTEAETIRIAKDMYKALSDAGINVMRVGLKATALINTDSDYVACGYHPAFRQLVEGELAKEEIEKKLQSFTKPCSVIISAPEEILNNAVGHKACNKKYFKEKYPHLHIKYMTDNTLSEISVSLVSEA